MRSYRAAMYVLHVDTFKARAMLAPRSRAVKKLYGATLTYNPHHSSSVRRGVVECLHV